MQSSGGLRRENGDVCALHVIARSNATKQSSYSNGESLDCFAEPVIGPRFACPM